jgi:hypothetical protein
MNKLASLHLLENCLLIQPLVPFAARSASIQGIPFAFQPECLQYLVMFDTWGSCICFSKIKNASNWSAQVYSITTEN